MEQSIESRKVSATWKALFVVRGGLKGYLRCTSRCSDDKALEAPWH